MVPACSFGPSVKRLLAAPRSLLLSVSVKTRPGPHVPGHWSFVPSLRCLFLQGNTGTGDTGDPNPIPRGCNKPGGKYRRIQVRLCLAPHKTKVPLAIPTRQISPSHSPHFQNIHPIFSVHKLTHGCKIINNCLQKPRARELKCYLNEFKFLDHTLSTLTFQVQPLTHNLLFLSSKLVYPQQLRIISYTSENYLITASERSEQQ